jgi:hypothetical protein
MKFELRAAALGLVAVLSAACHGATQPDASSGFLTVSANPVVMAVGETGQAKAFLHSTTATTTVTADRWQSSDPTVASIRTDGAISSVAKGYVTLTGEYQSLSATFPLRVLADEVELIYACGVGCGVKADGSEVWTLKVGQTQTFVPRAIYDKGTNVSTIYDVQPGTRSVWATSNLAVVTVTADGQVTARAPGTANVTAKWAGATASVAVTVSP